MRTGRSPRADLSTRITDVSAVASRVGLVAAAAWLAAAAGACEGSDAFYRHLGPDGGGAASSGGGGLGPFVVAGASGAAGDADASGDAGSGLAGQDGDDGGDPDALPTITPCTSCQVEVDYTCRSDDTGQASFILDVTNEATASLELSRLTLRYWYTIDAGKIQELDCDFAKLGCTNVVTSADVPPAPAPRFVAVLPPALDANEYAEIAFSPGALALDPSLDTGEIQLRLHNKDFSTIDQQDDYSFDCSMKGNAEPATKITAYVDDVLVWGTEPD
jgi:hypothetical protein